MTADIDTPEWGQVDSLCFSHNTSSLASLSPQLPHRYTAYDQSTYPRHPLPSTAKWFQLLSKSCPAGSCVVKSSSLYSFRLMQMCSCPYEYAITAPSWYNPLSRSEHWGGQSVVDPDRCLASLIMNTDLEQRVGKFIWEHQEISKRFVLHVAIWSVLAWMWCQYCRH